MRTRISITLRSDLLNQVDSLVDGVQIRNRSHALETLLERALAVAKPEAYILIGDERSLKSIEGKPVFEHTLSLLKRAGIEKVAVAITPNSGKVREMFGDGSRYGVKLRYIDQTVREGTAAALAAAKGHFDSTFVLIYGDNYFDFDLRDLVAFHKRSGSLVTMALTTNSQPSKYGVVRMQGERIVGFDEKPQHSDSYIISAGIFVVEPDVFALLRGSSFEKDVLPQIIKKNKLSGYVFHGKWRPV